MANGSGDGIVLPPIVKLILQVGVPSAIAVYLVWLLASRLDANVLSMREMLEQHQQITVQTLQIIQSSKEAEQQERQQMIDILRQQCINAANDGPARRACWYPVKEIR